MHGLSIRQAKSTLVVDECSHVVVPTTNKSNYLYLPTHTQWLGREKKT